MTSAKPTLLIIEDAPDLQLLYKHYFSSLDLTLVAVETGTAALEYLQQNTPKIILMDLTLQDMDTETFKDRYCSLKGLSEVYLIVLSGREDLSYWATEFSAHKSFKKPVSREVLVEAVKTQLI